MDGYSVKEAATVLGVPKRRVWELIARGVLSGAPEGDGGMRVFLQPRPGRNAPAEAARAEPPRTNGNGGHAGNGGTAAAGEASPFREILTEFRSLTERYGQALLALGEARGEVAALRSRVELLEARLDLRLPGPRASSAVAWEMPEYVPPSTPEPEPEPAPAQPEATGGEPDEAVTEGTSTPRDPGLTEPALESFATEGSPAAESEPDVSGIADSAPQLAEPGEERLEGVTPRRRRVLRSHSAIAGIAEALARAQDPTLADLPGAREAAEALAALQREVEAQSTTDESTAMTPPPPPVEGTAQAEPPSGTVPESVEASFIEPAAATSAEELVAEEPVAETSLAEELVAEAPFADEAVPAEAVPAEAVPAEAVPAEAVPAEAVPAEAVPELAPAEETPAVTDYGEAAVAVPLDVEPEADEEPKAAIEEEDIVEPDADTAPEAAEAEPVEEPTALEPISSFEDETAADAEPAAAVELEAADIQEAAPPAEVSTPDQPGSPYTTEVVEPDWFADGDFSWLEAAQAESETSAVASPSEVQAAPETEAPLEASEPDAEPEPDAEAAPAAEAIQEAFQAPELEPAVEPELAMDQQTVAEPEPAAMPGVALEPEGFAAADETSESRPEVERHEQEDREALPAAEAIQDAFEPEAPELEPPELEAPEEAAPEVEAAEVEAAELEAPEEAAPEETGQTPSAVEDWPSATATRHEADFAPAEVAFAVDRPSEPSVGPMLDVEPEARATETRAEAMTDERPSSSPPAATGLSGLAVEAAAPPTVQPSSNLVPPDEEELMWLGDEFEEASLEIATSAWRSEPEAPASQQPQPQQPQPKPIPPIQQPLPAQQTTTFQPPPATHVPSHEMSDTDLAQIAQDEGWDSDEVDAIRMLLGRAGPTQPTVDAEAPDTPAAVVFEPDADLPEVAAPEPNAPDALEMAPTESVAIPVDLPQQQRPDAVHPMDEPPAPSAASNPMVSADSPTSEQVDLAEEASTDEESDTGEPDALDAGVTATAQSASVEEMIRRSLAARSERAASDPEPDWLRRRRGPAARAYRRLRRLLP